MPPNTWVSDPISIHAPVKGATGWPMRRCHRCANFNPRSREGSDHHFLRSIQSDQNFNPRSREGSDADAFGDPVGLGISIHAPVKGATCALSGRGVRAR